MIPSKAFFITCWVNTYGLWYCLLSFYVCNDLHSIANETKRTNTIYGMFQLFIYHVSAVVFSCIFESFFMPFIFCSFVSCGFTRIISFPATKHVQVQLFGPFKNENAVRKWAPYFLFDNSAEKVLQLVPYRWTMKTVALMWTIRGQLKK